MTTILRRNAPFWISIACGIALWEIAGRSTSAAFMVPFSATMLRGMANALERPARWMRKRANRLSK